LQQLTNTPFYEAHARVSPDGASVLFHRQVSKTDFNLMRIDLADGSIHALSDETSEESYGSWSPDGKFIAFATDRDQKPAVTDIYIMNAEGEVVRKVTDHPAKDAYPFWSPDGQYLYFNSYREPQGVYRTPMSDQIDCRKGD
jgi:Tol biopolymer transport system component